MQLNSDPTTCTCMGPLFSPQETLFLVKKTSQTDSPLHTRNKSSELRLQEKIKTVKKSLKKRPLSNSNLPGERQSVMGFVEGEGSPELKIGFGAEQCTPSQQYSFSFIEDLPQDSPRQSVRQIQSNTNYQSPPRFATHKIVLSPLDGIGKRLSPREEFPQSEPFIYQPIKAQGHKFQQKTGLNPSQLSNISRQGSAHQEPVLKVHYPLRYEQQETQSWIPFPGREALLIEDFDKLFKNREEHQSHNNLAELRHCRARETKRSKRLEKQLVGRLAESEDEACSESAPSEVIGKGFESHFRNTFWEDEGQHFEETLATRSTNTKLSQRQQKDPYNRLSAGQNFKSDLHI